MSMTEADKMARTKRLHLSKTRKFRYYFDTIFVGMLAVLFFSWNIDDIFEHGGEINTYRLVYLISFPVMAFTSYLIQRHGLKLRTNDNGVSKADNYQTAIEAIRRLQWQITKESEDFIEARTGNNAFLTGVDQLFFVVIMDKQILFNSIGNVDASISQVSMWGQNRRNSKRFREKFELIGRERGVLMGVREKESGV